MNVHDEAAVSSGPVGISELRAAFAIRWDPFPSRPRGAVARQVVGRLGDSVLSGEVSATSLRPARSEDGDLVLPEVVRAFDGFGVELIAVDEPDPLCLIMVTLTADAPAEGVLTNGGEASLLTVSWSGLLRLTDEILHLVTVVLDEVAGERFIGPLAYGDLVGAGVLRLSTSVKDPVDLPIVPRPQLGSWQAGSGSDGDVATVFGDSLHNRRLLAWASRYSLRRARGEWAEAVVAFEAAIEAGMWAVLESLLIDHGWQAEHLTRGDVPGNAKAALSALQAHLGGNWTPARDDFAQLWGMRNRALHRSEEMTESDVDAAARRGESFGRMVAQRLGHAEVARKHPVTTYLFSADSSQTLSAQVYGVVSSALQDVTIDELRQLNNQKHPNDRRTTTANECPQKADTVWFP